MRSNQWQIGIEFEVLETALDEHRWRHVGLNVRQMLLQLCVDEVTRALAPGAN